MTDTTDPQTAEPIRIPIAHSVRYAARGLPDVPFLYGPGVIRPSEITLTYRAAPDSQLGRVHAYVKGRLWVDEREVPTADGYGQHYDDGLDGWPAWLAEEARLHDPAVPSAAVSPPPATDRAAVLLDVAVECNKAGGAYAERGAVDAAGAAFALMDKFLMEAGKAEYVATPCSAPDYCEDGGEPCSVHERLMGHVEGDHELCAPDCGQEWLRRLAAGERDEQQAQQGAGQPHPGPYRHYKGGEYEVAATACHTETGEQLVVYRSGDDWWCRPVGSFTGTVLVDGELQARFEPVDEVRQQPDTEAHPAEHTWTAELRDPLAEEWVPGTRYVVRDRAVNALAHARRIGPAWKDGTPTERRLVRATTTYTVETTAAAPAAGQPPADTGEEADRVVGYRSSNGDILRCVRHAKAGLIGMELLPVTSEGLPDGGLCSYPHCGADVLIPQETVHACPPDGSGLTPCCGRTPFELPLGDRISSEAPVTCTTPPAVVAEPGKEN